MKNSTLSMTDGKPMKLILSFAAPLLLGNIFQQLYNFVDTTIVGRFVGSSALAAVGAPGTIMSVILCWCFGLTSGAGIIIAQCFGARDYKQLRTTIGTLVSVLALLSAVMMTLGVCLAPSLLRFISTPESIMGDAVIYMRVIMLAVPFTMLYNGCASIMQNMGDSKTPLTVLIMASFINAGLDLFFVVVLHWGVFGAAVATAISQAFSGFICLAYLYCNRESLHIMGMHPQLHKDTALRILRTGIPSALQSCMISLGTMSVQRLINGFGTHAMAAYTASTKIDSIALMVVISMGTALSVYSGQNIGAGNIARIRDALHKTLASVLVYCGAIALIMMFFGSKLLTIFLDPVEASESIRIGTQYLKIIGSAYFMAGIMRCYLNVILGAGDVNISMITGLTELAVRIVASYILVDPFGLTGLWVAIPISWGCGSVVPLLRYYSGKWKEKRLVIAKESRSI